MAESSEQQARKSRIDVLEALLLAGSRIETLAQKASGVESKDAMIELLAQELHISGGAARIVAATGFERLTAGYARRRLEEELADLRSKKP